MRFRHQSQARAPLALAAVAFGAGVSLAGYLHRPPWLWAMAAVFLAALTMVAVVRKSAWLGYLAVSLALVCTGSVSRLWAPQPELIYVPAQFLHGQQVEIIGHITNDGALLAGSEPRERFDLEVESMEIEGARSIQPVGIRATIFPKPAKSAKSSKLVKPSDEEDDVDDEGIGFPQLAYGDRVKITAKLRLPRNFRNPQAFDYEGYLHGLGLTTLASVRSDRLEILPGKTGTRLGFWRSACRRSILAHVHNPRLWDDEEAALFAAMIVGDDSLLLRHVREEFQETGVYHLLVVSGMNVGLLALAVFWLARRLRAPQWAASIVTIALCVFYAFVAGMGAPILRAVLMLSLFLIARLYYRDRAALNATGFAALMVMVISPMAWFDPSFQLTFLALLAITGISLPVLERTSERYRRVLVHLDTIGYDLSLEPKLAQLRLDLRLVAGRLARFFGKLPAQFFVTGVLRCGLIVFDLLVVSSVTQAVLVLPMRIYFHRAAIVGLPANVVVLPLAGILMNTGVVAIALSYISFPLAHLVARFAAACLHWTLFCITYISHWNVSQWRIPDPNLLISLLAVAGIAIAFLAVRRRRVLAFAGMAVLFLSAVPSALYRPPSRIVHDKLEVTAIDVGQGDSLLLVSPQGKTMLIDGGGSIGPARGEFDFGEDVISPYLWSRDFDHLDVIVLTHAHGDHIGGLPRVIENFHPRELWLGINSETPALRRLYRIAAHNHVAIYRRVAGEELDWAGAHIRVLSPPKNWEPNPKHMNDDSLAFLVSYRKTTALLAGDLEKKMEWFIAGEFPRTDLLKVAHHGSATSTTPELLAAAKPKFAVISVGADNSFKHPRQEVLERLEQAHVSTYRTDKMGIVTFLLDGARIEASVNPAPD